MRAKEAAEFPTFRRASTAWVVENATYARLADDDVVIRALASGRALFDIRNDDASGAARHVAATAIEFVASRGQSGKLGGELGSHEQG